MMEQLEIPKKIGIRSELFVESDDEHIENMLAKVKIDLKTAIQAIEYQDISTKCQSISKAHSYTGSLRKSLPNNHDDLTGSPELPDRLDTLLTQLEKKLIKANQYSSLQRLQEEDQSSITLLNECLQVINNIQAWWKKCFLDSNTASTRQSGP